MPAQLPSSRRESSLTSSARLLPNAMPPNRGLGEIFPSLYISCSYKCVSGRANRMKFVLGVRNLRTSLEGAAILDRTANRVLETGDGFSAPACIRPDCYIFIIKLSGMIMILLVPRMYRMSHSMNRRIAVNELDLLSLSLPE